MWHDLLLRQGTIITSAKVNYLRRHLASEGIVTLGVTLCVCLCISLGGEGNALYPVLSSLSFPFSLPLILLYLSFILCTHAYASATANAITMFSFSFTSLLLCNYSRSPKANCWEFLEFLLQYCPQFSVSRTLFMCNIYN